MDNKALQWISFRCKWILCTKMYWHSFVSSKSSGHSHWEKLRISVIPMSPKRGISLQIIASKVNWLRLVSKWFIVFINTLSFKQVTSCSMHSIVTTFRGADIKVEVANFCAAMYTLIDQDEDYIEACNSVERKYKSRFLAASN